MSSPGVPCSRPVHQGIIKNMQVCSSWQLLVTLIVCGAVCLAARPQEAKLLHSLSPHSSNISTLSSALAAESDPVAWVTTTGLRAAITLAVCCCAGLQRGVCNAVHHAGDEWQSVCGGAPGACGEARQAAAVKLLCWLTLTLYVRLFEC